MRRRKCNPPPWVIGPDPNVVAHTVVHELIARMDPQSVTPTPEVERREWFDLLAEACESVGIPVVRMT